MEHAHLGHQRPQPPRAIVGNRRECLLSPCGGNNSILPILLLLHVHVRNKPGSVEDIVRVLHIEGYDCVKVILLLIDGGGGAREGQAYK